MMFGTYETLGEREKVTGFQRGVAETMQDYFFWRFWRIRGVGVRMGC